MRPRSRYVAVALALSATAALSCADKRPSGDSGNDITTLYALNALPSFHIALSPEARSALQRAPRDFVRGSFRYAGVTYDDVAIRIKGHRSMRRMTEKAAFKLRFDKYVPDRQFLGVSTLTLNNMVEDSTMAREVLAYRLMREMRVPAPNVGYAQVYVDGALFGLYSVVETVDDHFLERRFGDAAGDLFEGEYGCDLFPDDVAGFDRDGGKGKGRDQLERLAAAAAQTGIPFYEAAGALLDRESFLGYLAVSAFVSDFDGYRHSHNYRIYHHPKRDRWYFIPWGLDRVFKRHLGVFDSEGLLAKQCFADARCRLDYVRTVQRVVERFEELHLDQGVHVVSAFTAAAAQRDPRRPFTFDEVEHARGALLSFLAERPARVREQLGCIDAAGTELDRDGDGFGCLDCDDADAAIHPGAAEVCNGRDDDCSGLIDDHAACPCRMVAALGAEFALCDLPMTWADAADFCAAKGMTLARVDDAEQSEALYELTSSIRDERWWIGLSDRADEGTFRWHDGAPVTFTRWAKGEPDNDACNQDCVALKEKSSGRWHDTHCGQHRAFVCRVTQGATANAEDAARADPATAHSAAPNSANSDPASAHSAAPNSANSEAPDVK